MAGVQLDTIVVIVSVGLAMSTFMIAWFMLLQRRIASRKDFQYKKFRAGLASGLRNGIVGELRDAENLLLGCLKPWQRQDLTDRLGNWLRRVFFEITSELENVVAKGDSEKIPGWGRKLQSIIGEPEQKSPFAGLPDAEKNLLSDVEHFVSEGAADKAQDRLMGLAGLIQARTDEVVRLRLINRWAVPVSAAGMLLTIAFGVLALVT
jgi:hypothetical protein